MLYETDEILTKIYKPNRNSHVLIFRPEARDNSGGSPMDMDLDSPFSPGSASDLSDLFEPPTSSPPPSSLPKISLPNSNSSRNHHSSSKSHRKKPSDSKAWQNIIGEPGKPPKKATPRKLANTGPSSKMTVNMKVIDDKLKIIDDVPSSAVEMAVKEKVHRTFTIIGRTLFDHFLSVLEESAETREDCGRSKVGPETGL